MEDINVGILTRVFSGGRGGVFNCDQDGVCLCLFGPHGVAYMNDHERENKPTNVGLEQS